MVDLDLVGYVIGGVSVGEFGELIDNIVKVIVFLLLEDKFCYLMGVGIYREMVRVIVLGIDLFDCVIFICLGRYGVVLVRGERWNLKNVKFKEDFRLLDEFCFCYCC